MHRRGNVAFGIDQAYVHRASKEACCRGIQLGESVTVVSNT